MNNPDNRFNPVLIMGTLVVLIIVGIGGSYLFFKIAGSATTSTTDQQKIQERLQQTPTPTESQPQYTGTTPSSEPMKNLSDLPSNIRSLFLSAWGAPSDISRTNVSAEGVSYSITFILHNTTVPSTLSVVKQQLSSQQWAITDDINGETSASISATHASSGVNPSVLEIGLSQGDANTVNLVFNLAY